MSEIKNLEELLKINVFNNFYKISQIPRASHKEKEISNYIKNWAEERGLEVNQDSFNNLLIVKRATQGYENAEPVLFQAHTDMVCEKAEGVNHDFSKDPIDLVVEGDDLTTGGKTTLGADNGIGVAFIMSILEDETLKHPEINAILTTAEEDDLSGADAINPEWIRTTRLINLDNFYENIMVSGSAGGEGVKIYSDLEYEDNKYDNSYKITIDGLTGGHSGQDIDNGRANSIKLLSSILKLLVNNDIEFSINDIHGGNYRIAIPRKSNAIVSFDPKYFGEVTKIIEKFNSTVLERYKITDPNIMINIQEIPAEEKSLTVKTSRKIIDVLTLMPNGVNDIFGNIKVVESSNNIGELYLENDMINIVTEIRATYEYGKDDILEKIENIAEIYDFKIEEFAKYPSWLFKESSQLRDIFEKTYKEKFNHDLETKVMHFGLEVGYFYDKKEGLDAVSIGPDTWDLHSPTERVSISSTIRIYELLTSVIEKLN